MATKTITVTEEAYGLLRGLKSEYESFSHLFIRLAKDRSIADRYFGILKEDAIKAKAAVKKIRNEVSESFEKRENVLFRHVRNN